MGIIELGVSSLRNFFFEHPMATYAAALAYRGLFGLFPFLLILVVLASALGFQEFFRSGHGGCSRTIGPECSAAARTGSRAGRAQIQPLEGMVEHAQQRASGELLFFSIAVALWSVSAVARTLTEAFNIAYQVTETRRWWKGLLLSLIFGPVLALMVIVSLALMLIGPEVVERSFESGRSGRRVRLSVDVAALPRSALAARRGALCGLPLRS